MMKNKSYYEKKTYFLSILKVVYPNGENGYYLIKLYGVGLITNPQ